MPHVNPSHENLTGSFAVISRDMNAPWWIRRVWRPVRLGLVFVAAQGLLPNLVVMGTAVLLADVLGVVSFDFHGKTISDLPVTTGLGIRSVVIVLALGFTLAAWRWIEKRPFGDLGWGQREAARRAFGLGGAVGAISPVVVFAGGLAIGAFASSFPQALPGARGGLNAVIWLVLSCGLAPLLEEIWYRGYLLKVLIGSWGMWPAIATSGIVFGGIHLLNPNASLLGAFNIMLMGVMACLGVIVTGSLWFAVAEHALWNLTQFFLIGLPNSGFDARTLGIEGWTLLASRAKDPTLVSGGSFGIEASVLTTVVEALLILFLIRHMPKKRDAEAVAQRPAPAEPRGHETRAPQ
ncbi:MAG: CPBP family intramembrane metalloprotease [Acidobacteria bacterium]|nr:CPBP family intramembrane metalloprotease [Acidobacteriota bacterium]